MDRLRADHVRLVITRIAAALWLVALVYGSLAPAEDVQSAYVFGDFVLHAAGYFGLTVLLVLAQREPKIWITAAVAALIGVVMEVLQGFTGDRTPQFTDVLANTLGALLGAGFFWFRGCFRHSPPA